jgi:hypothetical protein
MFTGEENHAITIELAEQMTTAFQKENPFDAHGWFFGRKAIESVLAQDACIGIRFYGGYSSDGHFSPVIFGVTTSGADIGQGTLQKTLSRPVIILEMATPCPPYCGGD